MLQFPINIIISILDLILNYKFCIIAVTLFSLEDLIDENDLMNFWTIEQGVHWNYFDN